MNNVLSNENHMDGNNTTTPYSSFSVDAVAEAVAVALPCVQNAANLSILLLCVFLYYVIGMSTGIVQ